MGLGDFFSSVFGGENEYDPNKDKYQVDDNAYNYGGQGADEAAGRYMGSAAHNQGRAEGANAAMYQDRGAAYADRGNAAGARAEQQNALGMARARASGQVPSIAGQQAALDMNRAAAAQQSMAASARGPAALALAQQQRAAGTAQAQAAISGQAQVNAAQERLAAENSYAQQAGGMRAQDYAGAQQAAGMAGQMGQYAQQSEQAGIQYGQMEQRVRETELAAKQNREAQKSANANAVMGANAGVAGQNAQTAGGYGAGIVNGVADAGMAYASGGTTSDERAKNPIGPGDLVASRINGPAPWLSSYMGDTPPGAAPATWGSGPATASQADAARAQQATLDQANKQAIAEAEWGQGDVERMSNAGQTRNLYHQILGATGDEDAKPLGTGTTELENKAKAAGFKDAGMSQSADEKKAADKDAKSSKAQKDAQPQQVHRNYFGGAGEFHGGNFYSAPQLLQVGQTSDMRAKNPGADPTGGLTVLKGGGMDVMGSLKANSNFGTRFMANPGSMPSDMGTKRPVLLSDVIGKSPMMTSDEEAKQAAYAAGQKDTVQAFRDGGLIGGKALGKGAQNDPIQNANRSQVSSPYTYKPEYTPPEQAQGEPNVGPMAQNLASDPVAATAVKQNPQNGMLMLDTNKLTKLHSAGIASLQQQVDELRSGKDLVPSAQGGAASGLVRALKKKSEAK